LSCLFIFIATRKLNTAFKVAKIAENVGFDNMTHFGRVFKEITGLSPLKYRQTYKIESP